MTTTPSAPDAGRQYGPAPPPYYGPPQPWPPQGPGLPPYPGPQQYGYGPPVANGPQDKNGLGTASFVLGIVSLALAWIPFLFWVSIPAALTGFGLGLGNYFGRLRSGRASNHVMTWVGVGLSALAFVVTIIVIVLWAVAVSRSASSQ
jgi:hypothetical protein